MTNPTPKKANPRKSTAAAKKPRKPAPITTNSQAVEVFLAITYPDGVPSTDQPVVMAARSLAACVDSEPDKAAMWKEYRAALGDLMAMTEQDGDELEWLTDQLRAASGNGEE